MTIGSIWLFNYFYNRTRLLHVHYLEFGRASKPNFKNRLIQSILNGTFSNTLVYLLARLWLQCDQIWQFFGLWATFWSHWQQLICPNLPKFLGNFCKGVKIYHFLVKSFLGNFYRHLAIFSGHTGVDECVDISFSSSLRMIGKRFAFKRKTIVYQSSWTTFLLLFKSSMLFLKEVFHVINFIWIAAIKTIKMQLAYNLIARW